jgi:hypothetical protein
MTNTTKFTFIMTCYNNRPFLNETMYPTTKEAIDDIATGQIDADTIEQIINVDLTAGTSRDVTRFAAIEVWRILDANNDYAGKEMRDWLESFDLDCEHLTGETGDLARDFYGR